MSCPDCFSGSVHAGTPTGKVSKIYGLDTYTAEPLDGRTPKGIIVFITDAFGWEFVNNRLLADDYAAKGDYKVYVPDFMKGHAAPEWLIGKIRDMFHGSALSMPNTIFWVATGFIPFVYYNRPAVSYPVVKAFFEELRKAEGPDAKIAAAGFCWGGKHVLLLSHNVTTEIDGKDVRLMDIGFTGHPSMLALPADVDKMAIPVSFAVGDQDHNLKPEKIELIRKAVTDPKIESARGELVVYKGAGHGFCVRADTTLNDSAKPAQEAADQCINWFNKNLGIPAKA